MIISFFKDELTFRVLFKYNLKTKQFDIAIKLLVK